MTKFALIMFYLALGLTMIHMDGCEGPSASEGSPSPQPAYWNETTPHRGWT